MLRVALTGGIATGKSFCLGPFAALGVPIIDADLLARDAVAPGSPGLAAVAARFGAGGPARRRHARSRGARPDRLQPTARRAPTSKRSSTPRSTGGSASGSSNLPAATRLAIADIPLLFETGHEHDFDRVIVCACDPAEQVRRVMARDRLTRAPTPAPASPRSGRSRRRCARATTSSAPTGPCAETDAAGHGRLNEQAEG